MSCVEEFEVKWKEAYLTVEAAMVMPVVFMVLFLLMYLMFFVYDRCLLEQDCGILLVQGVAESRDRIATKTSDLERVSCAYEDRQYIAWEESGYTLRAKGETVIVGGGGRIRFPFAVFLIDRSLADWHAQVRYQSDVLRPTTFVRSYRKIVKYR